MDEARLMTLVHGAGRLTELLEGLHQENAAPFEISRATRLFLSFRAREKGVPFSGQFELTPLCNLDCKMCYVHLDRAQLQGREPLSAQVWEALMQQAIDQGMMYACLTGGECLAYPDFDRLYLFLHSRGVQVSVLTNGVLLNEERIRFFQEHPPTVIQVTLYGPDEEVYRRVTGHAVFGTVVRNLRMADAARLPIMLSLTPSKHLGKDAARLVEFAASLGMRFEINSSLMVPREETQRSKDEHEISLADYFKLLKLKWKLTGNIPPADCALDLPEPNREPGIPRFGLKCGGGRSGFVICWDGEMVPCNSLIQICAKPLEQGFAAAWQQINAAVNRYPLPVECEGCVYQKAAYTCPAKHASGDLQGHASEWMCQWCHESVRSGLHKL